MHIKAGCVVFLKDLFYYQIVCRLRFRGSLKLKSTALSIVSASVGMIGAFDFYRQEIKLISDAWRKKNVIATRYADIIIIKTSSFFLTQLSLHKV